MTVVRTRTLVGVCLVVLVVANATVDLARVGVAWDELRPMGTGESVPEFRLATLDGNGFASADLAGKTTIIAFWASWCGVCQSEMPTYQALHRSVADRDDVRMVLVNREGDQDVQRGLAIAERVRAERGLTMPMAVDDDGLYRRLNAQVLPHIIVVDSAGVVQYLHEGRVRKSTLTAEIAELTGR